MEPPRRRSGAARTGRGGPARIVLMLASLAVLAATACDDSTAPLPEAGGRLVVWSRADSPLTIQGELRIGPQDTLRIEPGVVVRFPAATGKAGAASADAPAAGALTVEGLIRAEGTPTEPIVLTRLGPDGYWGPLRLEGSGFEDNLLGHCRIEHVTEVGLSGSVCAMESCVLAGSRAGLRLDDRSGGLIRDCILEGRWPSLYVLGGSSPTLEGCRLVANDGIRHAARLVCHESAPLLVRCVLDGRGVSGSSGLSCGAGAAPRLVDCLIAGCDYGVYSGGSSPVLVQSTIANCSYALRMWLAPNLPVAINSILAGSTRAFFSDDPEGNNPLLASCFVTGEKLPAYVTDAGRNLIGPDPGFHDGGGDFRLAEGSPCIDVGNPTVGGLPGTDLAGEPRVAGVGIDIGAYEFQPGSR